ncbi:hypothetical protein F4677DRAFT_397881 [Hypoxylon crocopeplum]|nr:hypothetical protein F4677DRAFT_397881 [Hypoxylon crocopeplum]
MATTRLPTRRLGQIGVDVADLVQATGIAADRAVVGMTRATAVAHMMTDRADIVTEADSATATVAAAPTLSRFVAEESIATSTGQETRTAENGASKAATRIRANCDATEPPLSYRDKGRLSWWVSSVFCIYATVPTFSFCLSTLGGKQG